MKNLFTLIMAICFSLTFLVTPVFAKCPEDTVPVSILDSGDVVVGTEGEHCVKDDGAGSGIKNILNLVVDILTMGIGILGVIGITIVGIQYLTASGNEGQTRKAKQRMLEIVIGLAAYVIIYAALKWLLPGFGA